MAVIVGQGVQASPATPTAQELLSILSGQLTLSDVADSPQAARYAVASVDAANMPLLQGVTPVAGTPWPDSAGVTQFNGRTGSFTVQSTDLPQVQAGGVRSVLSTSPLTYSTIGTAAPYTIQFSCAAVSVTYGGETVSYNAAAPVDATQGASSTVTYYLYYLDPTYSGGTKTLQVTTSVQTLSSAAGILNLGSCTVTTPASGSGSGGGGSGGGGLCVTETMWLREGLQAKDAQLGDEFDCLDLPRGLDRHRRPLLSFEIGEEPCVRLTADDGCQLECSVSTPFDLPGGGSARAPDMLQRQVITDRGMATVQQVEPLGVRRVLRFHLGGVSYAAGVEPTARIYSHNATEKP
jgi:hypothetical protein